MEKDDFCHWPFHLLPLTEKVIRYLFASAEEVPHVLSLFPLRQDIRYTQRVIFSQA